MNRILVIVLCLLLYLVSASPVFSVQYEVRDLGALAAFGESFSINNCGQFVVEGDSRVNDIDGQAFDLGTIWPGADITIYDINDGAQVALYVSGVTYRWSSATGPVNLGGPPYTIKSCPAGMNKSGDIAGWAYESDEQHGVLWRSDGSIVDLGPGSASDINDSGQAVGVSVSSRAGVVWDSDGSIRTTIGDVHPAAINNAGQVVGNRWKGANRRVAFCWTNTVTDLPLLPGATYAQLMSDVYDINQSGQMIGFSVDALGRRRAVLWDNDHSVIDLGALPGYTWSTACAINDLGWIVGYSSTAAWGGDSRLTLWTPIPEPSSLLALAAGLLPLGLRRRRR